jgi:exodeoxyribonuclease VIII
MKDAVISTMTESEYRSLPALNASRFKAYIRSPFHFFNQKEVETTEAMRIGTAIHTACLEPERFTDTVAFLPDVDGRTTEGKAIKKAFEAGAVGKTILKAESEAVVKRAVNAILTHSLWQNMKSADLRKEQVLLGKLMGQGCKARLDIIDLENGIIRDIKSCDDASGEKFKYTVKDRLYWVQAGFYCLLAEEVYRKPFGFEFIAVETSDPSSCVFHKVDDNDLSEWKAIVKNKMVDYGDSKSMDLWEMPRSGVLGSINLSQYK